MIVPQAGRYRWIGGLTEADGFALTRVRRDSVAASWSPVRVDWVPETKDRPVCDFPIFYSIVRAFSRRAVDTALEPMISGGLELLELRGLDGAYVGVHCTRWIDRAAMLESVDQSQVSIHSTSFVPKLRADHVKEVDVFGVPELITKLFVSERFKITVEQHGLVGLDFHEVTLG